MDSNIENNAETSRNRHFKAPKTDSGRTLCLQKNVKIDKNKSLVPITLPWPRRGRYVVATPVSPWLRNSPLSQNPRSGRNKCPNENIAPVGAWGLFLPS
ncbi:MAG: hypothetical protein B6I25_00085 [Planctomycetales bacterium 4572_13]|nr:MAG: hypothetical protein B6I25_00085 [Planctomycetales bacterium 4572_13]